MNWWRKYREAYLKNMYLPFDHPDRKGTDGKAFVWWFFVHLIPASSVIFGLIWLDFLIRS